MLPRTMLLFATLALTACAGGSSAQRATPADIESRAEVQAVLDDFHAAAAEGDAERYLAHFTRNGVFFGTDPAERWTVQQFESYVRPAFARGGWTYVPRDRTVFVSDDGQTAWFDEMLDGPGGMVARGTGALARHEGTWKVAQYNFSVPFPNALWDTINAMIRTVASGTTDEAAARQAGTEADREAVRRVLLDYLEGFYEGDTTKLVRSVSPSVYKYGYARRADGYVGMQMRYEEFMSFANGVAAGRNRPPAGAPKEVLLFEVQDQTASARVTAWWGLDYLLLAKQPDGRWQITHVIWQTPPPQPRPASDADAD